MDHSESFDLASLIVLFDRIAELGRLANAAPEVVEDGGAASKKSAGSATFAPDYSMKDKDACLEEAKVNGDIYEK